MLLCWSQERHRQSNGTAKGNVKRVFVGVDVLTRTFNKSFHWNLISAETEQPFRRSTPYCHRRRCPNGKPFSFLIRFAIFASLQRNRGKINSIFVGKTSDSINRISSSEVFLDRPSESIAFDKIKSAKCSERWLSTKGSRSVGRRREIVRVSGSFPLPNGLFRPILIGTVHNKQTHNATFEFSVHYVPKVGMWPAHVDCKQTNGQTSKRKKENMYIVYIKLSFCTRLRVARPFSRSFDTLKFHLAMPGAKFNYSTQLRYLRPKDKK